MTSVDFWAIGAGFALGFVVSAIRFTLHRKRQRALRQAAAAQHRKLLQENLNGLIIELSNTDHESQDWLLKQAYQDTLSDYRATR